jgi:predicted secreted Zn-dependent protease
MPANTMLRVCTVGLCSLLILLPATPQSEKTEKGKATAAEVVSLVKLCSAVSPNHWRDTIVVNGLLFTGTDCQTFAQSIEAADHQLGCMKAIAGRPYTISWGDLSGNPPPSPNDCRW